LGEKKKKKTLFLKFFFFFFGGRKKRRTQSRSAVPRMAHRRYRPRGSKKGTEMISLFPFFLEGFFNYWTSFILNFFKDLNKLKVNIILVLRKRITPEDLNLNLDLSLAFSSQKQIPTLPLK